MRLKSGQIFYWLLPPLMLAAVILFFSGCFSGGFVLVEKPFSWAGTEINSVWKKWFPKTSAILDCSTSGSEVLAALAIDRSEFENLKIENENLRQQLDFFKRESFKYVSADIISRSVSTTEAAFVIDRGSDDGLYQGLAVIVADGHLIGKITSVSTKTSIVQPILGRGAKTAVSLLGVSRTLGISEGSGGSLLSLRFIPQDEVVAINNLVVTSGLEKTIPSGLVVGVITGVQKDPAAPFQTATIEPLVDIGQNNNVSVIIVDFGL